MSLTTEKKKPSLLLYDYAILIYGQTKVGKSTLLSQIDNLLFLNTGGGLGAIECYEQPIATWEEFLSTGLELLTTEHKYEAIAIDTIDRLHKLCSEYMMKQLNILYPSDLEYGKGWDMVKSEFMRPIMKLVLSKYGVFFVSHAKDVEIKTRTSKLNKMVPTMSESLYNIISPISDIILYYDIVEGESGESRILRTNASEKWIAGDRSGKLAAYGDIVMNKGNKNWETIQKIFNGEITKPL